MSVKLTNVSKKYNKELALDRINFEFEKGKIYGLLGQNGSGKSTILKIIAGLAYPTEGEVTVFNEKVTRKISKHVAYLTELDMFYDSFTVKQMIHFYHSNSDFQLDKAWAILEDMQLSGEKLNNCQRPSREAELVLHWPGDCRSYWMNLFRTGRFGAGCDH